MDHLKEHNYAVIAVWSFHFFLQLCVTDFPQPSFNVALKLIFKAVHLSLDIGPLYRDCAFVTGFLVIEERVKRCSCCSELKHMLSRMHHRVVVVVVVGR